MSAITTHRIRIDPQILAAVKSISIIPLGVDGRKFLIPNSSFLILPGSSFLIQELSCA
jgi:hypothetical protein